MRIRKHLLLNRKQTSSEIHRLGKIYSGDIGELKNLSIYDFFYFVRAIPYKKDKKPIEILKRPKFILSEKKNGLDCKKKCILMVAYAFQNNITYRLIGMSTRKDKVLHHIFPQFLISGNWSNVDATYPNYNIFDKKIVTEAIVV